MTAPTLPPAWLAERPTLLAKWDARGEPPEVLAARLLEHLRGIDAALGAEGPWEEGPGDTPVELSAAVLESFVRAGVYVDDLGEVFPRAGYSVLFGRRTPETAVVVSVRAGSFNAGRRIPSNSVTVDLHARTASGVASRTADQVLLASVEAWEPPAAALRDLAAAEAAASMSRGRWAPVIGQRTWISHDLGAIGNVPAFVRAELTAGGTLLAADDKLSAADAVAAIQEVLVANGILEIPHGPASS